jgi:hypothetical protein
VLTEEAMERTGAMKAYVIAYVVVLALLVLFLLNVVGVLSIFDMPDQGDPGGFAVPLAVFGVVIFVVILAAAMWPGAPRTPWFWLVGAIPGLLFFLPDIPIIIQAATAPKSVVDVVLAVAAAGSTVALLVSAVSSFRDARRLNV